MTASQQQSRLYGAPLVLCHCRRSTCRGQLQTALCQMAQVAHSAPDADAASTPLTGTTPTAGRRT